MGAIMAHAKAVLPEDWIFAARAPDRPERVPALLAVLVVGGTQFSRRPQPWRAWRPSSPAPETCFRSGRSRARRRARRPPWGTSGGRKEQDPRRRRWGGPRPPRPSRAGGKH